MATLTITVANLKGGSGKSTVALNIATSLHRAGHKVLLVDSDSQATLRAWSLIGEGSGYDGPPVVAVDAKMLKRDLPRLSAAFDAVVIDTPPKVAIETRAAMLVADVIAIPVCPGGADTWALEETIKVLEDAQSMRPELRAAIVLNRADRTALTKSVRAHIKKLGLPVLDVSLGARVAFGAATVRGQGVADYAAGSAAAIEVSKMIKELFSIVQEAA